jgi:COP9 signalosome complex subunit 2
MSDSEEEYEYDYGSDAESQLGSDADVDENDVAIEIENSYYEGEDQMSENPTEAIELFEKVVQMESEMAVDSVKWRFKALCHLVILMSQTRRLDDMVQHYKSMLSRLETVTRNECTDAINTVLDAITALSSEENSTMHDEILLQMYTITLDALKVTNNERLWVMVNIKLCKLYVETHQLDKVEDLLIMLKNFFGQAIENEDGMLVDGGSSSGSGSGSTSSLLEVYSIEIRLCAVTHDFERLKRIYPKTLNLPSTVTDPRIMGMIREEGGKLYLLEENYDTALSELSEGFRAYQEAGNSRAKICLKYVLLTSMLAMSDINPLLAPEAKVFMDDNEVPFPLL